MNYEKIGQSIGSMVFLGSVLGWMRIDNWSMQASIIMAVSGILIFWAGMSLEDKIQYRKHLKNLQREKEEAETGTLSTSMMKIINKYSLTEPDDLSAGVLEISKFIINSISSNLNKANEQDAMFAKGVFFLCIYDVIAVKYSTEPSSPNSHNYLAGMLAMESSVESPGGLLEEIMDYVYSNELDGMTTNLISSMVSQFIDKPNKKFINNLESTFKSFKR